MRWSGDNEEDKEDQEEIDRLQILVSKMTTIVDSSKFIEAVKVPARSAGVAKLQGTT